MRRRAWTVAIAVALGAVVPVARAGAGPPAAAPAAEARTVVPRYASVVVDATGTGDVGPVLRRRVQERADVLLRRNDVLPARSPDDTTISVTVHEATGEDPGFEFSLAVSRGGKPVGETIVAKCELCTESELVDAVESKLEGVIADLEPPAAAVPARTDPVAPSDTGRSPTTQTDRRRLTGKGIAGAALLAAGAAGIIVGGTLAALPDEPLEDDPLQERTTKPPGFALLGVGLAAAIVGGALVGVDVAGRKRRATVVPAAGRGRAGAVVIVRF